MTADELHEHLESLGYKVETIADANGIKYTVARNVVIPAGTLRGKRADVAVQRVETAPYVPPAAIHTNPALVPMRTGAPLGTQPSPIGGGWQYWSRRYDRTPTPQGLWAHVLTVLSEELPTS